MLMADIKTKIYKDLDLTVHTVTGTPSVQDVCDELDQYYSDRYTKLILWDLTNADPSTWSGNEVMTLISKAKEYAHLRKDGKTAHVLSRDIDYGIARMYQAYSEIERFQFEVGVFRDMKEALQWLGVPFIPDEKPKDAAI